MQERARRGGAARARKIRAERGLTPEDLPPLNSPQDAEIWLETIGRAVALDRLGHNQGRTVIQAVRQWLKAHSEGAVSKRLERLMQALETWQETGDPEPVLELVQ